MMLLLGPLGGILDKLLLSPRTVAWHLASKLLINFEIKYLINKLCFILVFWGFGVWGLGLGFGVWGLGFGVWGLCLGLGFGFGVWGLGFCVCSPKPQNPVKNN